LMAEAARICEAEGADLIDINFGCPAKKVTGGLAGSALMREPDLAARLVEAVSVAVNIPVTVKMRLGWDAGNVTAPALATSAVNAGARAITVHGRSRCQFYDGHADWAAIRAVREAVAVPLIVNGDIVDRASAETALAQSGADAVMIGRGCQGALWMPGLIAAAAGDRLAVEGAPGTIKARIAYMLEHHADMLALYGVDTGMRHARKHLGWHLDHFVKDCPSQLRHAILTSACFARSGP
jgi:tRNA-dihydrouridine synthase B